MGKTIEAVKDAVKAATDVVKDSFKGVEADAVIASFQTLLNSQKHPAPRQFNRNVNPVLDMGAVSDRTVSILKGTPSEFMFFGPADDLLRRMVAASGSEGLPKTGDQLVSWLKVHYYRHPNKKLFRDAYISLELTPSWAGRPCTLIRLERAPRPPKEYPKIPF